METLNFDDLFAHRLQYMDTTTNEFLIVRYLKLILLENNFNIDCIDEYIYHFYVSFDYPITLNEIINVKVIMNNNFNEENNDSILSGSSDSDDSSDLSDTIFSDEEENDDDFVNPTLIENTVDSTVDSTVDTTVDPTVDPTVDSTVDTTVDPTVDSTLDPTVDPTNQSNDLQNPFVEYNYILTGMFDQDSPIYQFINSIIIPITPLYELNELNDVVVTTDNIDKITTKLIECDINEKCTICLTDLEKGDNILDIKCKHIFHKECLSQYIKNYNHICPVCRQDIGDSKVNY